jgi:hypothetical protein
MFLCNFIKRLLPWKIICFQTFLRLFPQTNETFIWICLTSPSKYWWNSPSIFFSVGFRKIMVFETKNTDNWYGQQVFEEYTAVLGFVRTGQTFQYTDYTDRWEPCSWEQKYIYCLDTLNYVKNCVQKVNAHDFSHNFILGFSNLEQ